MTRFHYKKKNNMKICKVYFKYFASYMLILFLSISALLSVIQFDLKHKIDDFYTHDLETKVTHLAELTQSEFMALFNAYNSLNESWISLNSTNSNEALRGVLLKNELRKNLQSHLVRDVLFLEGSSGQIHSTYYGYQNSEEALTILFDDGSQSRIPWSSLSFDAPNLFAFTRDNGSVCMFFIPEQETSANRVMYFLDMQAISGLLKTSISNQTLRIDLYDVSGRLIASPYVSEDAEEISGTSSITAVCGYPHLTISYVYDSDLLDHQISHVFSTTYLVLFFLLLIGFICVVTFTNFIYGPRKLFAEFLSDAAPDSSGDFGDYMDFDDMKRAVQSIKNENAQLIEKLDSYQMDIQKNLLQSSAEMSFISAEDALTKVEKLLIEKHCYMIVLHCLYKDASGRPDLEDISTFCSSLEIHSLPLNISKQAITTLLLIPLSQDSQSHITEQNICDALKSAPFAECCHFYFSHMSCSPLDISRLYEEATVQAHRQKHTRVFALVDEFGQSLSSNDYPGSLALLSGIFDALETSNMTYFIQSVLLALINQMVHSFASRNISMSYYSNEYNDALYWSRTQCYRDNRAAIQETYAAMLSLLLNQASFEKLSEASFSDYIAAEFCSSDFSINQLGDHFQVSGSYISYWFKKTYDQNLSDYLWQLRFDRAVELMQDPQIGMSEIAEKVGYDNYSSFRRKFKTSCGQSPSEYRKEHFGF